MISVLSSLPSSRRKSSSRPRWWSVWLRKPAKTSIIRLYSRLASGGQRVPVRHVRVVPGQLGVGRDDAQFLLPVEHQLPVGIPTAVELPGVPVGPFRRHVMRGVGRAETQVQVERLVRVDLLGVGDEPDRLVDQVLGQVVTLLRRPGRLDLMVVVDQVRIPLAGVAAEETVEPLEPAAQRPPVVRADRGLLVARRQVPLADHVGVVTLLEQDLRQEPVLHRHDAVVPGVAGGELGDRGHPVGVMVAAGDDARPARRAQRRGVHVVVPQPVRGDRVERRGRDRAAVTTELTEPGVIQARWSARSGRPPGRGPAPARPGDDSSVVRPITPGKGLPGWGTR